MRKFIFTLLVFMAFVNINAQIIDPVKWTTKTKKISETEFNLIFEAKIDEGWHMYSQFTSPDGSLPLEIKYKNQKGNYELVGKTTESKTKKAFNDIFGVDEVFFEKNATLTQKIKLNNSKTMKIEAAIDGQACIEGKCIQLSKEFAFNLPKTSVIATGSVDSSSVVTTKNTNNIKETNTVKKTSEAKSKEAPKSKWNIFFLTLLAGIFVTFTPCVFPMIPMTVSFFLKQSAKGNTSKGRINALFYGFFIILIYVLISVPFHIFQSLSPDIFYEISTNPYLNIFFFVIFVIFAISFLGAFEITMPSSLANKVDNASNSGGLLGVFFMALTLIIVSFSCTGPALGLVIGSVLSTDGGATFLTIAMLGFGIGLALPFMLFALFPSLMTNLPKSGGWLNTVKVVFGFVELALAFKFLSLADLVMDWHILERETFIAIWIAIFAGLTIYLLGKISLPHDNQQSKISVGRLLLGITTLFFTIYLIPGLWGAPLNLISGFPPPMSYSESPNGIGNSNQDDSTKTDLPENAHYGPHNIIVFKDYDKGLAYAKQVNKPVLIDFTGVTCTNCRRMEELVWSKPEILSILKEKIVLISLYVDDQKDLPKEMIYTSKITNKQITTYGKKWSDLAITKYQANVQPYYVLMNLNEDNLNTPVGYTPNITEYKTWLENGISKFKK
jgi:thiol:disulfide interchange protein